jgi:3-hydroxymyristoyl/3-hydroxydecanoyl-(acyl carrier protein) dehydratase
MSEVVVQKPIVYRRSDLESIFLPIKQMLQVDRVCEIDGERIVSEADISSHWVFPMHFPSDPIFPGSLLIEAAGQTVAIWAWDKGLRGNPRMVTVKASFHNPILPEDRVIRFAARVRQRKNVLLGNVEVIVNEQKVAEIQPVLIIIPPQEASEGYGK